MELKIAAIMVQAGVLCGLLYLFGRDEADYDFQKVAMVVAVISLVNFGIEALLTPQLGFWVLALELGVIVVFVEKFCWLPWKKAALVGVLLMAVNAGMAFGMATLIKKVDTHVDQSMGGTAVEKQSSEGMKVLGQFSEDFNRMAKADAENYLKQEQEEASRQGRAAPAAAPAPVSDPRTEAASARSAPEPEDEVRTDGPDWIQAREQLVVTARMSDGQGDIVAVVNDRMVNRGEKVAVRYGGYRYIFKLTVLTQSETVWEPVRAEAL